MSFSNSMAPTGETSTGAELEVIQTEDVGFLSIAGDAKVRLTSAWSTAPIATASLLSIAHRQGIVAAAGPDEVVIATTEAVRKAFEAPQDGDSEVRSLEPQLRIPMSMRVSHIAFTADEKYLVLSAEAGGGLAVYETQNLLSGSTSSSFELNTEGQSLRVVVPNPTVEKAELCAIITDNGNLHMANLQQQAISSPLKSQVSCLSWSAKGKQLCAGMTNGTICQMTPEGDLKAEMPAPPGVQNAHVSSLLWLENHVLLTIHTVTTTTPPESVYHLVTRTPPSAYQFQKMTDPVLPFGSDKVPHHCLLRLRDFDDIQDLLIVSSTATSELGLVTRSKKPLASDKPADAITGVFTTTELLDDTKRPTLPMTESMDDSVPVGVSLDLSSKDKVYKPIPTDEELEESATPLPGLWVMTQEGILCSWWVVYTDSVKKGTAFPGLVAAQESSASRPAASAAAPASSFGAAASTSAFGGSSTPSAFGAPSQMGQSGSLWGTAASKTPSATGVATFGSSSFGAAQATSTPAFGKPSAFGQASQLGIRSSPWAAGGKSAPAFGQSGFSGFANSGSGAENSPSPFGGASAGSNAPASGGFASFANKSGFASAAGNNSGTSIFAAAGQSTSTSSPFGSGSAADTAFPPKQQDKSGGSPFGSTPFKLESSFKKDATKTDDDASAKPSGGSLFGSGFGSALSATQDKPVVTTPAAKDEEMDESEAMQQQATPQNDRSLAPAATEQDSTTPTTTPAPSKFGGFAASTTPAAPSSSSLFANAGGSKPSSSLFGQPSKTETTSVFGQPAKIDESSTSSIFGKPSNDKPSSSIFTQPSKNENSTASIFGQPSKNETASSGSIFGQPSKNESTTSSIFGKPAQASGSSIFGSKSEQSQPANPFANWAAKKEDKSKGNEENKEDAPLPPDTTSKVTYPVGDSSASSATSNAAATAQAPPSSSAKEQRNPFSVQTKTQPSKNIFDSVDTPEDDWNSHSDGSAESSEVEDADAEEAPLPPDPTKTKAKTGKSASPGTVSSIPVIPEEDAGDTEEEDDEETEEAEQEDEDEEEEEEEEEQEGDEEGEDAGADGADSEGSGVDVAKDFSPGALGTSITPGYTPQGSFDGALGTSPAPQSGMDVSRSRPMFGEISRNAPMFARPSVTGTSPRSPSPVRSAVPGHLRSQETMRSVSAPGMASQMLGGRASQSRTHASITARGNVDPSEDPFMQQHRKQKAKQEAEETKPLVDEEDEEIQRILASEIEPTLTLDEFIAHSNVEEPAQESIPSQVEAVYKDINAMIDTLGLNSRTVKAFIMGHTDPADDEKRSPDDLDSADDWVCCQVNDLGEILEEDLRISLGEGRVDSLEDKLEVCQDLARDMHRLRAKQEDLKKILTVRMDPDQAEVAQSAPLSVEQATQQNELRREFAQFSKLLSATEEALTMLRTRLASLSASSGKANGNVPTVEAVVRTITKMTSMVEKRSGDIDVLENQMRKVRLNSVSREGSPAVTPRKERSVMFSPDATPSRTFRHSMTSSVSHLGRATPPRKKLSGFSREEKVDLMEKKSRRQAVLLKLQANVEKRGVNVWNMEETE